MDKLTYKYENLIKALATIEKTLVLFEKQKENSSHDIEEYKIYRDSLIQRFEYSIDLFWKYLKLYIETTGGIEISGGPNVVIRESYSQKILSEDETQTLLEMIKNRNKTSHIYVEEIAEMISFKIPDYYKRLFSISYRLKP